MSQSTDPRPIVDIFTDGACSGNPGPGGWGAVLHCAGHTKEIFGGDPQTTNNRMELTAAIKALQALKKPALVHLHTDSTYLRTGITQWITKWKQCGWKTSGKKPVKNQDLWQQLDMMQGQHQITWHWVKGHAGNENNERADRLARRGVTQATPQSSHLGQGR